MEEAARKDEPVMRQKPWIRTVHLFISRLALQMDQIFTAFY